MTQGDVPKPGKFLAVRTVAECRRLDESDVMLGYLDGFQGNSISSQTVSHSYLHGWRNGAVDGGFISPDEAQVELEKEFFALRDNLY
ncbi:MAG: hypothetical protein EOP14_03970 [Pseudomonas sp.]|nr:MAG: hypothetical protein EOP14_03970 [Pseudomonas sp.]